jgi:hypothetical protein
MDFIWNDEVRALLCSVFCGICRVGMSPRIYIEVGGTLFACTWILLDGVACVIDRGRPNTPATSTGTSQNRRSSGRRSPTLGTLQSTARFNPYDPVPFTFSRLFLVYEF